MLQQATLTFLHDLSINNNKTWFDEHRTAYVAAKEDVESLVTELLDGLSLQDAFFKEQKAKECIMRIFRDVRFSKDKTPYKSNFGIGFSKGGRKSPLAGYYLHIQPGGKSFAAGGMWQPEAPMLKAVRQEIDYNLNEFTGIIQAKPFKKLFKELEGDRLKKVPQGYAEDNPALEYLKMKSFIVSANLQDAEITQKGFSKKVIDAFAIMKPFIDFLNRSVS